jgi:hypothetical protein
MRARAKTVPSDGRVRRTGQPPRDDWWDARGLPVVGDIVHFHYENERRRGNFVRVVEVLTPAKIYKPPWFMVVLIEKLWWMASASRAPLGQLRPVVWTPEGPRCVACELIYNKR